MPEWLKDAALASTPISPGTMATRLAVAAALGVVVAITYRLSHGRLAKDARTLVGTLVLLTILLAMVTMVIGDSVARAFGLVGALSIVRFRTVVEDTRDTAFVIFAVVVGMAVGTGLVLVALLGVPFVAAAAIGLSFVAGGGAARGHGVTPAGEAAVVVVRLNAGQPQDGVHAVLDSGVAGWKLSGVATARQGTAMDLTYSVHLRSPADAAHLVAQLNGTAGVQSVDLRGTGQVE